MSDKPIAIVTGVGPGTGSAIVRRFAAEGFRVIAMARSPDRIRALEAEHRPDRQEDDGAAAGALRAP